MSNSDHIFTVPSPPKPKIYVDLDCWNDQTICHCAIIVLNLPSPQRRSMMQLMTKNTSQFDQLATEVTRQWKWRKYDSESWTAFADSQYVKPQPPAASRNQ